MPGCHTEIQKIKQGMGKVIHFKMGSKIASKLNTVA